MASTSGELRDEEGPTCLSQLRTEFNVFDRIIFKHKNQHRRTPYFSRLLKVRRDLCLLNSAGLEEILKFAFQVIHGKNPKQIIYILERLKWESSRKRKHTFVDRLLGVARLLSQMVEALIKSAVEVSSLLAMNFFAAFALTTLSLLGRLRVLLQQILLDVASAFNMVSTLAKKEQSFQLTLEGVKDFRYFYTTSNEFLALQYVWENGRFCLHETSKSTENDDCSVKGVKSDFISDIHYETMGVLVEGSYDVLGCESEAVEACTGNQQSPSRNEPYGKAEDGFEYEAVLSNDVTGEKNEGLGLGEESDSQGVLSEANSSCRQSLNAEVDARQKVAFVSVGEYAQHGKRGNLKKAIVVSEGFVGCEYVSNSRGSPERVAHTSSTCLVPISESKPKAIQAAASISLGNSMKDEGRKLKKARYGTKEFGDRDSGSPEESDDYFFNLLAAGSLKDGIF
ncbi:unnamed protein product [Victoria cruziana]